MSGLFRLMLITDRRSTRLSQVDVVRRAVSGGVDAIQVREKDLNEAELQAFVEEIKGAAGEVSVVVNGSIAVAGATGLGVQLPEAGPSIAEARGILGPSALIGRSVHSVEQTRNSAGVDYLIAGHVFATASKPGLPPIGLDGLAAIVAATSVPVIAIGGITRENARQVIEAGAKGVAIMSAINQAADPRAAAAEIRSELDSAVNQIAISLNGRETSIAPNLSIQDFLQKRGLKDRLVVVEINGKIAPKSSYSIRVFEPGDSVEIVHFVGGG